MALLDIPNHWILEYAVRHPTHFSQHFIQQLIDDIARESHQPSLTPPILIALLRRIFDSDNSLQACSPDMHIDETLYYLQALEDQRAKRIKALESRGGAEATKCIKLSRNAIGRYGYITHGLKLWTVFNEIRRVPFVYQNAIGIIATLYGDDTDSQAQETMSEDEAKRIRDLKRLVEEIAHSIAKLPEQKRKQYDASKNSSLQKNERNLPWEGDKGVRTQIIKYLEGVAVLFDKSEVLISLERRLKGIKIDEAMIKSAAEALQQKVGQ